MLDYSYFLTSLCTWNMCASGSKLVIISHKHVILPDIRDLFLWIFTAVWESSACYKTLAISGLAATSWHATNFNPGWGFFGRGDIFSPLHFLLSMLSECRHEGCRHEESRHEGCRHENQMLCIVAIQHLIISAVFDPTHPTSALQTDTTVWGDLRVA